MMVPWQGDEETPQILRRRSSQLSIPQRAAMAWMAAIIAQGQWPRDPVEAKALVERIDEIASRLTPDPLREDW